MQLSFYKMHGLGNDFMIVDTRSHSISLGVDTIKSLADRRRGVGFDQLVLLKQSKRADVYMQIYNRDGSCVETCGNALRCVAMLLCQETGKDICRIEVKNGLNTIEKKDDLFCVNIGTPVISDLNLSDAPLTMGVRVNVGNPHAVFFVDDVEKIDLNTVGPLIENHKAFPDKTNVEVVAVLDENRLRMRVWERGAGVTMACGTGAAASMAAAVYKGLVSSNVDVVLDGGILAFEWAGQGDMYMSGSASFVYKGVIDL